MGALIVGSIVLRDSYSKKLQQLNEQISVLQDQVDTLKKQNEALQSSPTLALLPNDAPNEPTINEGWKKFISDEKLVFSTNDWQSYTPESHSSSFSIEYPADWSLENSVLIDSDNKKVAEFLPGFVILKSGQKCFDKVGSDESGRSELISQTNITIDQLQGALRIEKVLYEGGSPNWTGYWYPNIYCLSEGNQAFVMSFYEDQLNSNSRELFTKSISTLKFE